MSHSHRTLPALLAIAPICILAFLANTAPAYAGIEPTGLTVSAGIEPTGLTVSAGIDYIDASWTQGAEDHPTYNIEYKPSGGSWTSFRQLYGDTTITITGLAENTTYQVRVQGVDDLFGLPSGWVTSGNVATMPPPTPVPTKTLTETINVTPYIDGSHPQVGSKIPSFALWAIAGLAFLVTMIKIKKIPNWIGMIATTMFMLIFSFVFDVNIIIVGIMVVIGGAAALYARQQQ